MSLNSEETMQESPRTLDRGSNNKLEVVRRTDHLDFESMMHSEENTWAVSYADLLMVLLSFFVIFFSVESAKNKDALIYKILTEVKNPGATGSGGAVTGKGPGSRSGDGRTFTEADAAKFAEMFRGLSPVVGKNPATLTLEFPDNIFPSGQYKMRGEHLAEFHRVFETLKPYDKQLEVLIVGHSDSRVVAQDQTRKYEDNFELSSLRASAAIREAINVGFSERHIRAQAASHNERNTRSISITVRDISN